MPIAEVRQHHGSPALYLDGEPTYPAVFWCPAPTVERWPHAQHVRDIAKSGVHIYTFGWPWPEPTGRDHGGGYDYSEFFDSLEAIFRHVLDADPDALFLPRLSVEAPNWWVEQNPDELETFSDGSTDAQSYASPVWRADAAAYLRGFVWASRELPFADRFIGYHVCAGFTAEWLKNGARDNRSSDFNPSMIREFRSWLMNKYKGDEAALRRAWHDPNVTFETAFVPDAALQERADFYSFRDPAITRQDIDYFACLCDVVVDNIERFCGSVKEASDRQVLAGVFYGYVMELWWSNGWFGRHPNQSHTSYQRIGHLALDRVLTLNDVDFLASPYSYGMRGIGGTNGFMIPSESARLNGKLYFSEDDTRTHLATTNGVARFGSPDSPMHVNEEVTEIDGIDVQTSTRVVRVLDKAGIYVTPTFRPDTDYGALSTLEETESILKRNFSNILTRHIGIWWGYPNPDTSGTLAHERLQALVRRMVELGNFSLTLDRSPQAEIAVIVDEDSWFYQAPQNNLAVPLIQRQYLWHLPRIGAPFDLYLTSDLTAGKLQDYKCYIFLNQFHANHAEREAIKAHVENDGKVAVWIYASGFAEDTLSATHMLDLTGMALQCHHTEWGANILVTNFDHPITADLPSNTMIGTDSRIGPIFSCVDSDAIPLGVIHFTRGRFRTGFAVKEFPEHRTVWIGAPNVPSNVLREIVRYAGVHVYSESDDVLYADRQFVALYTLKRGLKSIALPNEANVIDAFTGRSVAENTTTFTDTFESGDTRLYYYGTESMVP